MISQFFVVSPRGDTLIFKDYRGDVPRTTSEKFWRHVKFAKGEAEPVFVSRSSAAAPSAAPFSTPGAPAGAPLARTAHRWLRCARCARLRCFRAPGIVGAHPWCYAQCIEGVNYMYVKKSGLYLCITSRYNLSPCMILELLERLTRCVRAALRCFCCRCCCFPR